MDICMVHNSRELFFRNPFGAVPCESSVVLSLEVRSKKPPGHVTLHLSTDTGSGNIFMEAAGERPGKRIYSQSVTMPETPGVVRYYFSLEYEGKLIYYGNNGEGMGGAGCFDITVYEKNAGTPGWFKDTVVYQIFVDRFYRGGEQRQVPELPPKSLLHLSWDDVPFYIRDSLTHKVVRWDFFGGNLPGVLEKLPYLNELGVGCIYFNPVFLSHSNHKYDTGDYLQIDPGYGDNDFFRKLCEQAKAQGINIILDGVFSHTGSDSIYFNKEGNFSGLGAYQSKKSPYYPWYCFCHYPDGYESWWGIESLPNVNELEPSYFDFILYQEDSVIRYWMEKGIKGWRLDVADELPDEFIKKLRAVVKSVDPEAVIIGEVWEDASRKISYGVLREYFQGDELDSVTNYLFRNFFTDFFLGKSGAEETGDRLMSLYENYPRENFYALMNFTGSHDIPRILTVLGEAPPEETMDEWSRAEYRLPPEKRRLALERLKLFALVLFTFPGVPCIYYGDEAGMEGFGDPYNRGTYPWGKEDMILLSRFQKLIFLRNLSPALRTGEWQLIFAGEDIFCMTRWIKEGRDALGRRQPDGFYLVIVNRDQRNFRHVELDLNGRCGPELVDLLCEGTEEKRILLREGIFRYQVPPLTGLLLTDGRTAGKVGCRYDEH